MSINNLDEHPRVSNEVYLEKLALLRRAVQQRAAPNSKEQASVLNTSTPFSRQQQQHADVMAAPMVVPAAAASSYEASRSPLFNPPPARGLEWSAEKPQHPGVGIGRTAVDAVDPVCVPTQTVSALPQPQSAAAYVHSENSREERQPRMTAAHTVVEAPCNVAHVLDVETSPPLRTGTVDSETRQSLHRSLQQVDNALHMLRKRTWTNSLRRSAADPAVEARQLTAERKRIIAALRGEGGVASPQPGGSSSATRRSLRPPATREGVAAVERSGLGTSDWRLHAHHYREELDSPYFPTTASSVVGQSTPRSRPSASTNLRKPMTTLSVNARHDGRKNTPPAVRQSSTTPRRTNRRGSASSEAPTSSALNAERMAALYRTERTTHTSRQAQQQPSLTKDHHSRVRAWERTPLAPHHSSLPWQSPHASRITAVSLEDTNVASRTNDDAYYHDAPPQQASDYPLPDEDQDPVVGGVFTLSAPQAHASPHSRVSSADADGPTRLTAQRSLRDVMVTLATSSRGGGNQDAGKERPIPSSTLSVAPKQLAEEPCR